MSKIAIIGQSYDTPVLDLDGLSGMNYTFTFDKQSGFYVYEPKNQDEANDIFATLRLNGSFDLTVLVDGSTVGAPGLSGQPKLRPKPLIEPRYYNDLDPEELAALAQDCGVIDAVTSWGKETLRRVIGAFYLGAGWKAVNPPPSQPEASSILESEMPQTTTLAQALAADEKARAESAAQMKVDVSSAADRRKAGLEKARAAKAAKKAAALVPA